ncbi:hypothetical protein ARALYDRAFT_475660, partial [Arabidopsis lyrata subsp. lyrata]
RTNEMGILSLMYLNSYIQNQPALHKWISLMLEIYMPSNLGNMMATRARVRDRIKHEELKADLVEHVWQHYYQNQS